MENALFGKNLIRLECVNSTNDEAFRIAAQRSSESGTDFALTAREQTAGKGRLGRSFISEKDAGLWLSVLKRKTLDPEITAMTAVSVCCVLEKYIPECRIKWPNDIVVGSRKICGILCEQKNGCTVIGIGINLYQTDFKELSDIATSARLCGAEIDKDTLLEELLAELGNIPENRPAYLEYYKQHCCTLNSSVRIIRNSEEFFAFAEDIDNCFRLKIKTDAGKIITLNSGEVSVRP